MTKFLKKLDWSKLDISNWSSPVWLEKFRKSAWCIEKNLSINVSMMLLEMEKLYINPQNNFARVGAVDEKVTNEISTEFKDSGIGFRTKEDPVVCFDFKGQNEYKDMLDMPHTFDYIALFTLHRHFAGNEEHANVSHLPEAVIKLPSGLSKKKLREVITVLARKENLEGQTSQKDNTWQDTAVTYLIQLEDYTIDGKATTAEQKIERLEELLDEDKGSLKSGWKENIITYYKEHYEIYKPIDKYTTNPLLVDWSKNYDNSFMYRGMTLDNMKWQSRSLGKPQQLFSKMKKKIIPLVWDNGARDRIIGKLVQRISRDLNEKNMQEYGIFLTVNQCKTAGEIEADRKSYVSWIEEQFSGVLKEFRNRVHLIAFIPQNFHLNVVNTKDNTVISGDDRSKLIRYEDYL